MTQGLPKSVIIVKVKYGKMDGFEAKINLDLSSTSDKFMIGISWNHCSLVPGFLVHYFNMS